MSLLLSLTFLAGSVLAIMLVVYYLFTYILISRAIFAEVDQALETQAREALLFTQTLPTERGLQIVLRPEYSDAFAHSGIF